jgi:excisionase family DNA binding protein
MPVIAQFKEGDLLLPGEVAKILRVSRSTVYRWVEDGTLPAIKLGGVVRIHASALAQGEKSEQAEVG